jgi:hypothetical protein
MTVPALTRRRASRAGADGPVPCLTDATVDLRMQRSAGDLAPDQALPATTRRFMRLVPSRRQRGRW